jgi:O-antigen ligase
MGIRAHSRILFSFCALFALTVTLSKSASSIILGAAVLYLMGSALFSSQLRERLGPALKGPLVLPFFIYMAVLALGLFISTDLREGFNQLKKPLEWLAIFSLFSLALGMGRREDRESRGMLLLSFFLFGISILNCIGLLEYAGAIGTRKHLILEPLGIHHIWYGNLNAVALYAGVGMLFLAPERFKVLGLLAALLALPCILFAQSRGVWAGVLITGAALAWMLSERRKSGIGISVFLFAAAVFFVYMGSSTVRARLDLIIRDIALFQSGHAETSLGARFIMWKGALKMFLDNPISGVGTGDYGITLSNMIKAGRLPAFIGHFNQPHSMYLFLLAITGVPGLLAYLFIYWRGVRASSELIETERFFGLLAFSVLLHYFIAGFSEMTNTQMISYTFALVMGICL